MKHDFETPLISQLALEVTSISEASLVQELLSRFQSESHQPIMPVLNSRLAYTGSVSRRAFLSFMTRAFARELFLHKTVGELLDHQPELAHQPVQIHAHQRVDQAMRELLEADPHMQHEALPVLEAGKLVGLVKVTDMMASLSESQERLIEVMLSLSERLQEEVTHAALLQRHLLPPSPIRLPGLQGSASLVTSTEVGGDYYDYYCVADRWVVILVGDVSGHGVAAGTMVSAAKAVINLVSADGIYDPAVILQRLNHALLNLAHQRLLMTMFVASLDAQTGQLLYANAGHQFPYRFHLKTRQMEMLEIGGLPLGKSDSATFPAESLQLAVGDRLFFYTDGLLEEENEAGEPLGYDRLENALSLYFDRNPEILCESVAAKLRQFAGHNQFADDVTLLCLEHHERIPATADRPTSFKTDELGLVRITEAYYRTNLNALIPRLSRQNLVYLAEGNFSDLLNRFANDGIRRVLPRFNTFYNRLGWQKLLTQQDPSTGDDWACYLPKPRHFKEFPLRHSADKDFIMDEAGAWLGESVQLGEEHLAQVSMLIDELVENGLYAAPRDGKGRPLYSKGEVRELGQDEQIMLVIAEQDSILALHLQDSWGTLTPATFLNRIRLNAEGSGLIAGEGGAGLYLMWRLGDYLQFRVYPHHQTQVTILLDLASPQELEKDKGFQFIYHGEIHENSDATPTLC